LTEDLSKKSVAVKFVPRLLSQEQKEFRAEVAQDLLETANKDPDFPQKVIIADESWVYGCNPETKAQSSQWNSPESPSPKKARPSRSNSKDMLTVYFYHEGVVHHQYDPPGQTIPKGYYIEVLRRLRDAVRRKRPQLWQVVTGSFITTMRLPILQLSCMLFFFGRTSHLPGLSATLQPRFGSLRLLVLPKAKIAVERNEIRECDGHTVHKPSQRCLTAD
jgi:hypothetical protein